MKKGDRVYTPRFCTVKISEIFADKEEAEKAGFTEPTYYEGDFEIRGRSMDLYHMEFAAYRKNNND